MPVPADIYLFRITHIDNLKYILKAGKLTAPNHVNRDANYIGIGDVTLINSRGSKSIPLPPGGTFLDYVAFYFGTKSPMLYSIKNGYNKVTKRDMEEIIYIVTEFNHVKINKLPFVFFDGHGYHNFSKCYNKEEHLTQVPWTNVHETDWRDTESQPDRKREKQAEFLVYQEISLTAIIGIGVYNDNALIKTNSYLKKVGSIIKVKIHKDWYY